MTNPRKMSLEDIIKDVDGQAELETRDALAAMEDVLRDFLRDYPDFSTGEIAFAYATMFKQSVLAFAVAVLLRDKVEMDV